MPFTRRASRERARETDFQSLKSGATEVAEVPAPELSRGGLLIQLSLTLISAGTEQMLMECGKASLIEKALQ